MAPVRRRLDPGDAALWLVHDMRGAIARVQAQVELVMMDSAEGTEAAARLADAMLGLRRLNGLTAALLETARLEAGDAAVAADPVSLGELVEMALRLRRITADSRGVAIANALDEDFEVLGDGDLLMRVVENILDNALRYTPADGHIRLWSERDGKGRALHIGNSGPAVPAELRPHMFDKFNRNATRRGGAQTGLGLYFCHLVVAAHGGTLSYEERAELPATFRIWLPEAASVNRAGA
jgi:signal transduction histidine kinase